MKQPHIIIDYAKDSEETRSDLLRHLTHLQKYFQGAATIEVMAHGQGLNLLLKEGGLGQGEGDSLATYLACRNTMSNRHIAEDDIVTTQIVPSGLGHIVERQLQGWAYLA